MKNKRKQMKNKKKQKLRETKHASNIRIDVKHQ